MGQGRRAGRFGALVLGAHRGGELHWVGNCGTGFTERDIDALLAQLAPLRRETSPFAVVPKMPKVRQADVTWVEPELVCEVEFAEWTHDGHLRAPSFQGLRDDKPAEEVRRETPLATAASAGGHVVKLSNLDKLFWPDEGITKGDLLDYYRRGRAGARAASARPAVHDAPLSRRRVRQGVLPEGRAVAHAGLDSDGIAPRSRRARRRGSAGGSRRRS